ncbi:MAG TPA: phosphotransferase [Mycobacteriales bacterium]|nr:phosphotransferase [Mycobacteriales bacterium]
MALDEPIPVRVIYSLVDPEEIERVVGGEYDLGRPESCRLVFAGHNDTYEVRAGGRRFAFRLQSRKWWKRGESDARFELDLLTHLHRRGVPVIQPIRRRNGDSLGSIRAPEGDRFYSLFTWAEGAIVDDSELRTDQTLLIGRTMAAIHVAADEFVTDHTRYRLDEATLLDHSLNELADDIRAADADDVRTIEHYVEEIRARLAEFDPGPGGWGIIHGDVYWANLHFTPDNRITVFDFDLCGYGWRAYDLAYYYTRIPEPVRAAALTGYQSVRKLSAAELDMLTTFGRLAWIRADGRPVPRLAQLLKDPYV